MTSAPPRRCPRCDAPLAPEQDWCLECGHAVTTRIVPPPGWRLPLIAALAVLALLGVGVAVAVSSMSGDADRAAAGPGTAAATPAPARKPARTRRTATATAAAPAPVHTATTTATARTETVPGAAEAKGAGPVPLWPAGTRAYTIVVPTARGRREAEKQARRLIASGHRAGILKTDGFDFFTAGSWVVWLGRYADRPTAEAQLKKAPKDTSGAYVTLIRRRGG